MSWTGVLKAALPIALFSVAGWVLHRQIAAIDYRDVARSMRAVSGQRLALAIGLTLFSYFLVTFYDVLALAYLRRRVRYLRIVTTSFISSAFGHNIGLSVVSGGSVRYRLYSNLGLSTFEIAQVIAFCTLTFWVGSFTLGGVVALFAPISAALPLAIPVPMVRVLGTVLIGLALTYLGLSLGPRPTIKFRKLKFPLPSYRIALGQMVVPSIEWLLGAAVLLLLLPAGSISYLTLLTFFLLAQATGSLSQVPAGLGVFESIVLSALSPRIPAHTVLGCLLLYRFVYYLGPFALALALLLGSELRRRGRAPG